MTNGRQPSRRDAVNAMLMSMIAAAGSTGTASAASAERSGKHAVLVAYLSRSGNTRVIAGQLQRTFGADLFEIRTAQPWPEDYEEMVAWAERLRRDRAAPALADEVVDMAAYRTIFLGSPVWGASLPAPVGTFLTSHDFSGKTLVPFVATVVTDRAVPWRV